MFPTYGGQIEPRRGEFRGGPREPSPVVLAGTAEREDGPATAIIEPARTGPTQGLPLARFLGGTATIVTEKQHQSIAFLCNKTYNYMY